MISGWGEGRKIRLVTMAGISFLSAGICADKSAHSSSKCCITCCVHELSCGARLSNSLTYDICMDKSSKVLSIEDAIAEASAALGY